MTKAKKHPLTTYREEHVPPLNITELAAELGVDKATVSRWEKGKRRPSDEYLPIIAKLTNTPIPVLMGLEAA